MVIKKKAENLVKSFGTGFILKKNVNMFATAGITKFWVCVWIELILD